jgi:hypothetical protein
MAYFVAGFGRIMAGFTGCKSMAYRSNLEQSYRRRRRTATIKGQRIGVTGVTLRGLAGHQMADAGERKKESAISRVLSGATIHLGQPSPATSSDLPGSPFGRTVRTGVQLLPYLVLLQAGFSVPRRVTTRAVRSYRTFSPLPALACLGGMFSVALSMGSHPPGVTWRPARRSPDFPPALVARQRLPDRLRAA